jgi:hypothetical protein
VPAGSLEPMKLRGTTPRLVALGLLIVVPAAIIVATWDRGGVGPAASPSIPIRVDPNIGPFQGLGTWVDLYDAVAWADPAAAVADMAAHGVRTLYLQTSNYQRPSAFVNEAGVAAFLDAGAADGVQVVAWYLSGFVDLARDGSRAVAAIRYASPAGNRFAGFGLDIESPAVKDPALRTRRLLELTATLRAAAGESYPLAAITPSPRGLAPSRTYWPGFPWQELAHSYDAILPMTYFTFVVKGERQAAAYTASCISLLRRWVGNDQVPIHMIGGIAQRASAEETRGFVEAVRARGLIGASYYTWSGVTTTQWAELGQIPTNPVASPALPAPLGGRAMGNIPGGDLTHPHEVVYSLGRRSADTTLMFDVFGDAKVSVSVNWQSLGDVVPAGAGVWSSRSIAVPASMLDASGPNTVEFVAAGDAPTWGVRRVALPSG